MRFPVHVDKVGRQTMTVKGTGGTVSDAVARSVLVVPDGQAVPVATSGALGAGTITNTQSPWRSSRCRAKHVRSRMRTPLRCPVAFSRS